MFFFEERTASSFFVKVSNVTKPLAEFPPARGVVAALRAATEATRRPVEFQLLDGVLKTS